jgi:16S rRNA (guanine966-N2)-methyltransferase
VLDLFAGSGALGFEALSRGAAHVVFIEKSRSVVQIIERNAKNLGVEDRIEIIMAPLDEAWNEIGKQPPFDIVMADPPYSEGWEERLLAEAPWDHLLEPQGLFVIEWGLQKAQSPALPDQSGKLVKVREKNYGDSVLTTFEMQV